MYSDARWNDRRNTRHTVAFCRSSVRSFPLLLAARPLRFILLLAGRRHERGERVADEDRRCVDIMAIIIMAGRILGDSKTAVRRRTMAETDVNSSDSNQRPRNDATTIEHERLASFVRSIEFPSCDASARLATGVRSTGVVHRRRIRYERDRV
jgi:hypothetical protein